jgi:hypothetical protein
VIQVEWELEPGGSVVAQLGRPAFRAPRTGEAASDATVDLEVQMLAERTTSLVYGVRCLLPSDHLAPRRRMSAI